MKAHASLLLPLLLTFHVARGQQNNASFPVIKQFPDSITLSHHGDLDSMIVRLEHRLDSGILALNRSIDSTYSLIMSPGEYHQHATRLYEKFGADFLRDTIHVDDAGGKLKTRINGLKAEVEQKKAMLDSLMAANDFFDPRDLKAKLALSKDRTGLESRFTNDALSAIPGIASQSVGLTIPEYGQLPSLDVIGEFPDIDNAVRIIEGFTGRAEAISVEQLGSTVEHSLLSSGEGTAVAQTLSSSKELEETASALKETGPLGEKSIGKARKKFVDHLAGHEDKIASEIESMEKLQKKYHSVTDVRYLPKHRTNPEKGKPFVERLIVGTGFHTDNRDAKWTSIDIAPYAGYKFSDRFRACIGGTYRIAVDIHDFEFSRTDKTFGYRAFGNYRILNGLFAHLEAQALKTTVPSWFSNRLNLGDPHEPMWIPMAYVGIMKSYHLGRRLQGQTQMLYDFLAVSRNFDFNKVTFRFGLEYKLQKRKRLATEPEE